MAEPISTYDHISQNNKKLILLMGLFPLSLALLLFVLSWFTTGIVIPNYVANQIEAFDFLRSGVALLPNATPEDLVHPTSFFAALGYTYAFIIPVLIFSAIWLVISYFTGDKMMMKFAGAKPLAKKDNPKLYNTVENVAIMAGVPCPQIYLIQDSAMNAFATGRDPKHSAIAFTTGLVETLSPLELQGVTAHEMSHIVNRDIRLNMMVITSIGILGAIGTCLLHQRIVITNDKSDEEGKGNSSNPLMIFLFLMGLGLLLFETLIAPLIHLAISRMQEYNADATGAQILHNPKALADALEKIANHSQVASLKNQKTMAVACIASPLSTKNLQAMTSTHPPIEERIRRLRSM